MSGAVPGAPVAILAGSGAVPALVTAAISEAGRRPIVFAFANDADPRAFGAARVHSVRLGEIGTILRLIQAEGCREAVFIGGIGKRPDVKSIRPDFATVKLVPRIVKLLRGGDSNLLSGLGTILADYGVDLISPLSAAPELALGEGVIAGRAGAAEMEAAERAAGTARMIGGLDIGQAVVVVGQRIVAVEDAGGTDELLRRVAALRERGRIAPSGGVLVKCMKPQQDPRLDIPTIGPLTVEAVRRAMLDGVAAEAGRTIVAGVSETLEAFRDARLFLLGLKPPETAGT